MYIRRIKGPIAVTLPDGTQFSRSQLPPENTRRWVASRKAAVVKAVRFGLITEEEARETWALSEEELGSWLGRVERHGEAALKATAVQRFRD